MSNEISNAVNEIASEITESVNAGFKTLGDLIQEALANSGSQEAAGFEVTANHGPTRIVVSDADPSLNELVDPAQTTIRKVNSATAGC
jgi:hypothetical protein